jgi:hypothetical protein
MENVEVRPARPDEWALVGGLRLDSLTETGGVPDGPREAFAQRFASWAAMHGDQ